MACYKETIQHRRFISDSSAIPSTGCQVLPSSLPSALAFLCYAVMGVALSAGQPENTVAAMAGRPLSPAAAWHGYESALSASCTHTHYTYTHTGPPQIGAHLSRSAEWTTNWARWVPLSIILEPLLPNLPDTAAAGGVDQDRPSRMTTKTTANPASSQDTIADDLTSCQLHSSGGLVLEGGIHGIYGFHHHPRNCGKTRCQG
jgi:hypothetical protein